jgi:hypothetical protein
MANLYDVVDYGPREPEYDYDPYADDERDEAEEAYWQFFCGVCDESPCIDPNGCAREDELYVIHMRQTV